MGEMIMKSKKIGFVAIQITSDPLQQDINIGSSGNYTITVSTNDKGTHTISFDTLDDNITARLFGQGNSTGDFSTYGSYNWSATSINLTSYNFTFEVKPIGGVVNQEYDMEMKDKFTTTTFKTRVADVFPAVVPIPELATIALVGAGMIGLIAIRRRR
jgi:hypothetical protein